MSSINLTKDEAIDAMGDSVAEYLTGEWRWGYTKSFVFPRDGKFYLMDVRIQPEEGAELQYGVEAVEVHKVAKTIETWEPVK